MNNKDFEGLRIRWYLILQQIGKKTLQVELEVLRRQWVQQAAEEPQGTGWHKDMVGTGSHGGQLGGEYQRPWPSVDPDVEIND